MEEVRVANEAGAALRRYLDSWGALLSALRSEQTGNIQVTGK